LDAVRAAIVLQDPLAWTNSPPRSSRHGRLLWWDRAGPGLWPAAWKAVVGVVERDAVDQSSQDLGRDARPRCARHHRVMMENKVLGRYRDQAGDDTWPARS